MSMIVPVVLCGGVGSRLWPMSRSQSPKQFHPVEGEGSMTFFQATVQRHRSAQYGDPVVVTALRHLPTLRRQLDALQCRAEIIAEPVARNTGPAVLAAALEIAAQDPEALMLILPSDHVISGDLDAAVAQGREAAEAGMIVLFGITPGYAETGYGYILDAGASARYAGVRNVARFVEKPPREEAERLCEAGDAYWASGISLFKAKTIIEEFQRFDKQTYDAVTQSRESGIRKPNELHLSAEAFRRAIAEPTERIVFEHSSLVRLAPVDISWSDVGSWTSVHGVSAPDENGNVFHGDVIATETENALVRSGDRLVALVGVSEVIVIDTPDALLVTRRGSCQDVKKVVETLHAEERREVVRHSRSEHNWGESRHLPASGAYDMSIIKINSGTSINIDPLPGRKIIMMHGNLDLFDGLRRRRLSPGEHASLENASSGRITNAGDSEAEALLISMRPAFLSGTPEDVVRHVS